MALSFVRACPPWAVVPFLMLSLFSAYGLITGVNQGPDDFAGRLASTAHLITTLPQGAVLGYEAYEKFTADSGFAYTLTQFGVLGFVGIWTAFVMLPCKDARGWQFHFCRRGGTGPPGSRVHQNGAIDEHRRARRRRDAVRVL